MVGFLGSLERGHLSRSGRQVEGHKASVVFRDAGL